MSKQLNLMFGAVSCGKGENLVDRMYALAKNADKKNRTISDVEYATANEAIKRDLIQFSTSQCGDMSQLGDCYDPSTKQGFANLIQLPQVNQLFFAAISATIKKINSREEVQSVMPYAQVLSVAEGDSYNMLITPPQSFVVESTGYSNASTLHQAHFGDNVVIAPTPSEASFYIDLTQFNANMFDLGNLLYKLALSFRAYDQQKVASAVFDATNIASGPFYLATFDDEAYIALAQKIGDANNSEAIAYGTKVAFHRLTQQALTGVNSYATVDEAIRNGYVRDILGVPSVVLGQSRDSANNYNFRVPNNKIILAPANTKIARLCMGGNYYVHQIDEHSNAVLGKGYQMITESAAKCCPDGIHGMQIIGSELL